MSVGVSSTLGYANGTSSLSSGAAATLSVWANAPSSLPTGSCTLLSVSTGSAGVYMGVGYNVVGGVKKLLAFVNAGGGEVDTTNSTALSAATWYNFAGVYGSGTVTPYLNGVPGTGASYTTPTGMDTVSIGSLKITGSVVSRPNSQVDIAHAAVWNVALSAGELAALAAGVRPNRIRPQSLVGYWPLWGFQSPDPDLSGGGHPLTFNISPTADNDAPIGDYLGPTGIVIATASAPASRLPLRALITRPWLGYSPLDYYP